MDKRIILHIDMDCFFAQIEERENPRFKGKSLVVGAEPLPRQYGTDNKGNPILIARGRGVVSTCNYEARKYGIHSALPVSQAYKLCPGAVFLPPNMKLYQEISRKIFTIVKRYSLQCEIVSLDEAYLDLSFLLKKKSPWREAGRISRKLKKEIMKKQSLTATVGIGSNKLIAKIAAQQAKPDGLLIVKPQEISSLLDPLGVRELPGVGVKTAQQLEKIKIVRIKQLRSASKIELKEMFGKPGIDLYYKARGIDESEIKTFREIKSIGKEHTFTEDTNESGLIFKIFEKIIERVYQKAKKEKCIFRTITVVCRFSDFTTHTKSETLEIAIDDYGILRSKAKLLLLKFLIKGKQKVRLIGLRLSNLKR